MDNQFIYCPKCSTRNFAEDEVCGVCKTKLSSQTSNQPIKKATVENLQIGKHSQQSLGRL
jgi:hypothetical protein